VASCSSAKSEAARLETDPTAKSFIVGASIKIPQAGTEK
jgi:hypothetical protein